MISVPITVQLFSGVVETMKFVARVQNAFYASDVFCQEIAMCVEAN
jgi:hypothetical protein